MSSLRRKQTTSTLDALLRSSEKRVAKQEGAAAAGSRRAPTAIVPTLLDYQTYAARCSGHVRPTLHDERMHARVMLDESRGVGDTFTGDYLARLFESLDIAAGVRRAFANSIERTLKTLGQQLNDSSKATKWRTQVAEQIGGRLGASARDAPLLLHVRLGRSGDTTDDEFVRSLKDRYSSAAIATLDLGALLLAPIPVAAKRTFAGNRLQPNVDSSLNAASLSEQAHSAVYFRRAYCAHFLLWAIVCEALRQTPHSLYLYISERLRPIFEDIRSGPNYRLHAEARVRLNYVR